MTIWRRVRSWDPAVQVVLAAALLSFPVWAVVWHFDLHLSPHYEPANYKPYFAQHNWWAQPFMFLGLAPALWLTWRPFQHAWAKLAETGVLRAAEGRSSAEAVAAVQAQAERWRAWALALSLAVALAVNVADLMPRAALYGLYGDEPSCAEKLATACKEPDSFVKWLLDTEIDGVTDFCAIVVDGNPELSCPASDPRCPACVAPPTDQHILLALTSLQQFALTLFGALLFFQVMLHTLLFGLFERLACARETGAHLALNCVSPVNEFGLEHWNYALNNFYWAACPGALAVFLSRTASAPEDFAAGQQMLGFVVPAVLLLPMIATVLVRQARLPAAWATLQPDGPVDRADFGRQALWPFDRNWASKLGIVLAFALAALALGYEFSQLVQY